MTSQGARGRTSGEMLFTLGVDGMQGGPHQAYRDVISQVGRVNGFGIDNHFFITNKQTYWFHSDTVKLV